MKAISTGNTYKIYDETLRVYDKLPAQSYTVRFDKMSGFYLEKHSDIEIKEDKIYGVHTVKVDKVLRSFDEFNRSLGVILSGDKGIGKSLFAKILSIRAVEKGLPLIIVDTYIPGIASYIEEIEQEVVVLFDEFDKTFASNKEIDSQAEMLSLFDGVAQGKKLFVITCNELRKLNDYLVNRPGRFHYHFRFEYPTPTEIKEYLQDKLEEQYYEEINKVIGFSRKIKLNYDCLRAIAFEINITGSFEEAIKDLNILNVESEKYSVILCYEDGTKLKNECYLDLFGDDDYELSFYKDDYEYIVTAKFVPSDCEYDRFTGLNIIEGENVNLEYANICKDDSEDIKEIFTRLPNIKLKYVAFKRKGEKKLHYAV